MLMELVTIVWMFYGLYVWWKLDHCWRVQWLYVECCWFCEVGVYGWM